VEDHGGDRGRWTSGGGPGVGKEQPPSKASTHCLFLRVEVTVLVMVFVRSNTHENEQAWLVFEGGGGGVGKEQLPSKMSAFSHFQGQ